MELTEDCILWFCHQTGSHRRTQQGDELLLIEGEIKLAN